MTPINPLHFLQQVQGVSGAFMLDFRGTLVLREAPPFYPETVFQELAQRVPTLLAAGGEGLPGSEEAFLRCSLQSLYLRRFSQGYLGVLCQDAVQISALRVASNIVAKQLESFSSAPAAWPSSPPPVTPAARTLPGSQPPPQEVPRRQATRTGIWG
jgi:hypothetical protein